MSIENEGEVHSCINMQILRASHYVLKTYDDAYRHLGIRATQMPVIGLIARKGPITIRQIADEMESERSVMSRKLQVMEKNGWISEDPLTTGKEKSFILANEGRALIERVLPVKHKVQQQILSKLSEEERNLLLNLCSKLKQS
ncbi:MAG: MarR family transcriptional regulator [Gammaproteobacteria bacterium]|nr:MarR family transcriptional regulator [Gammaproteobacteria bacterium]